MQCRSEIKSGNAVFQDSPRSGSGSPAPAPGAFSFRHDIQAKLHLKQADACRPYRDARAAVQPLGNRWIGDIGSQGRQNICVENDHGSKGLLSSNPFHSLISSPGRKPMPANRLAISVPIPCLAFPPPSPRPAICRGFPLPCCAHAFLRGAASGIWFLHLPHERESGPW